MSNEIIQIVACDDYEGFQHLNILFSERKIILTFKGLFNDETDLMVRYSLRLGEALAKN
jgi:hypothetical protein